MDLPAIEHLMISSDSIREVTGFGMAARSDGYVFQPTSVAEIKEILDMARSAGRKVVLRGTGLSYGDASLLPEGVVLDLTKMKRFLSWDSNSGVADCEPGVTIEDLWRAGLPNGWWPPVVSGTMYPTLGGALGMNIHGKNNFKVGTLGSHVIDMDVLFPNGKIRTLGPPDPLFHAVISSAGLLGIITRIKVRLKQVASGHLKVYAESIPNWDSQFEAFAKRADSADYMVSWVDCFAKGTGSGRGLFHAAWHDADPNLESLLEMSQDLPPKMLGVVPKSQLWRLLKPLNNRLGMMLLNTAKHYSAKFFGNEKMHRQTLVAFSFLLDYAPDWRNAYLPGGFIQYQSFVPKDQARQVFSSQILLSQKARQEPFLGVLKKHVPDPFLLSHGVDGFSLALDYKVTDEKWADLQRLCHQMNDLVLEAGGRFYFAKDYTMRPSDAIAYLGGALLKLRSLKEELDPEGLLDSAISRRLKLFAG
jgi:decaprenylphospho-beta-D-ribofuranose 2-oxidase